MTRTVPTRELQAVLAGGNHLACQLIERVGPEQLDRIRLWRYDAVLAAHGQPVADMHAAWAAIMKLRDKVQL